MRARTVLIIAVVYLGICALAGVYLADVAVKPFHRALPADAEVTAARRVQAFGAELDEVTVSASDNATLRGWLFTPSHPNGNSVLVLHGVSSTRMSVQGHADLLLKAGYTVLTPDARAHGASEGTLVTYGILERDDIQRWIDFLRARTRSGGCVNAFGSSMGAAQLLQVVDRPNLLCSVVVESPFSTFREIAYDRVGQYIHVGDWFGRTVMRPAVEIGLLTAKLRYDVDLTLADPMEHLAHSRVPVLIIHSLADTNIPPRHARLLEASHPHDVTFWLVEGARHGGTWKAEPIRFPERVLGFFAAHDSRPDAVEPPSKPPSPTPPRSPSPSPGD
jgi:pimeloyl-ACP methyl ester carboxylesterase